MTFDQWWPIHGYGYVTTMGLAQDAWNAGAAEALAAKMAAEKRLALQSMPDDLMKLAKDQYGPHYLQFELWVGTVIDKAFDAGKASATRAGDGG